eukprot:201966-Pelagomonas_calceolata.AAC.1
MKLPGWTCASPYLFVSFRTMEYPIWVRSDKDSVRAAGVASGLIRITGFKEVMLGKAVCAVYIHMHENLPIRAYANHFHNHSAGNVVSLSYHDTGPTWE